MDMHSWRSCNFLEVYEIDLDKSLYNEKYEFMTFATRGKETKGLWNLIEKISKLT